MGWLQRMFGRTEEARLERGRHFMARERYNDVRLELDGVSLPEAVALREAAMTKLVEMNLAEAEARFRSGDEDGAKEHINLARTFGATREQLRSARRMGREIRAEQRAAASRAQAEKVAARQEEMGGDDPLWRLPPDHPRLRYAVLVESYPESLRGRLVQLGDTFAAAVMMLEEGNAAGAWANMEPFVRQDPVACFERARAALAAGQVAVAATDLQTFGREIGHQRIGNQHTASMLARVLAHSGQADVALEMIQDEIQRTPAELELQAVRVGLLEALDVLEEAESAAVTLLQKVPRQMGLYRQLARIRERRGERVGAAEVLEWGLDTCCGSPGSCGNQPLDVQAVRSLARLYLEDRVADERVEDLLAKLGKHVQEPSWEDGYLAALVARNNNDPRAQGMAHKLMEGLTEADPRRQWLSKAFAM